MSIACTVCSLLMLWYITSKRCTYFADTVDGACSFASSDLRRVLRGIQAEGRAGDLSVQTRLSPEVSISACISIKYQEFLRMGGVCNVLTQANLESAYSFLLFFKTKK